MKVPMRWLKEYTEIPLSAADYAEKNPMVVDFMKTVIMPRR